LKNGSPVLLPTSISGISALEVALRVTEKAGETLMSRLHGEKEVSYKGRANLVSDVDKLVEHQIIEELHREFPDDGFLAEESEAVPTKSGYTWIVDPLDGTRNYILGIPFFCVIVALAKDDEVLMGLTYDPVRGEMFQAVKGGGAFLNGSSISVSDKTELDDSLLSYDLGYVDAKASMAIELVLHLWPNIQGTRIMGSAGLGLAYAACGRIDMYFHHNLSPWDIATGLVLLPEAGGVITDKYETPSSLKAESVIASGSVLHSRFLAATKGLAWRQ